MQLLKVCRKRTLVSIGTHDLDKIEGPFTYAAMRPQDIKFVPLKSDKEMDGNQLMEHLDVRFKENHLTFYSTTFT
jgi:phenylalanyl-tRNA synthetase beta chain